MVSHCVRRPERPSRQRPRPLFGGPLTLRCRAAETIRGGGDPTPDMACKPPTRMGPPPRSFAADAHGCIVVRIQRDRPNTSLWRDDPRPTASSPQIVSRRKAKSARREAAANAMGLTPYAPYKSGGGAPPGRRRGGHRDARLGWSCKASPGTEGDPDDRERLALTELIERPATATSCAPSPRRCCSC